MKESLKAVLAMCVTLAGCYYLAPVFGVFGLLEAGACGISLYELLTIKTK